MANFDAARIAHQYIDDHWSEHLARVQALLRQPSISAQKTGLRETADLLRGWLSERGATVEYHGDLEAPIILAEWQTGAPRTLLLYGMYDVQPVDHQPWSWPPFAAEIHEHWQDGPSVYARGACNSKGPLAACINAIEALVATGGLPLNVKYVIEGQEEIGSPGLEDFYRAHREHLRGDAAYEPFWSQMTPGAPPLVTLGTKGVIGLQFVCRSGEWGGPTDPRHSSDGVWLGSAAWRLVQALASLVNRHQEVAVEGIPALGPMDADDEALLRKMAASFDDKATLKRLRAARFKRTGLPAFELLRQYQFAPALNINGLICGYTGPGSHTIIPTEARALADFRIPAGVPVEQVMSALRRHLDARGFQDVEIIPDSGYPGARAAYSSPVVQALVQAYRSHGYEPLVQPMEASATPYYLFTEVLGLSFAWGGLGCAGGSHGPDEWAAVQGIHDLEQYVATFFHAFARQE